MTTKQVIKLSALIDKMGLKIDDPKASQEKIGADLMMKMVCNLHKAEKEAIDFVCVIKKCTPEEAEEIDVIALISEMLKGSGVIDFFKSAARQKVQESLNC